MAACRLPLEQIDLMLRIVQAAGVRVERVLDIGCGDGILGRALLERFPQAHGTFLDFSPAMVTAAGDKLQAWPTEWWSCRATLGSRVGSNWYRLTVPLMSLCPGTPFTTRPTSASERYMRKSTICLRRTVCCSTWNTSLHVCPWAEQAFNDMMIDSLWDYHQRQGSALTREDVARQFVQRDDWSANILAPLDDQCQWLREIGYVDVDCFFKAFELAIFGGRK